MSTPSVYLLKYLNTVNVLGYIINSPFGEFAMNPVFVIKAAQHFD